MNLKYITSKRLGYASLIVGGAIFLYGMTGIPNVLKESQTNLENQVSHETKKGDITLVSLIFGASILTINASNIKAKEE